MAPATTDTTEETTMEATDSVEESVEEVVDEPVVEESVENADNSPEPVSSVATPNLKIGKTTYGSLEEYRATVHEKLLRNSSSLTMISPFAFAGFSVGGPLDFKLYKKLGFEHPRDPSYYKLTFDDEGNAQGDPRMVEKYEAILRTGEIEDPITIYPLNRKGSNQILVLDGATRSAAIAYALVNNPEMFSRVPIVVHTGDEASAIFAMIRRNMEEYSTPLGDVSLMKAIKRLHKAGHDKDEIAENLGKHPVKWRATLDNYLKAGQHLIPELVVLWGEGKMTRNAAFVAAKTTKEEQEAVAEKVRKGDNVTGKSIRSSSSSSTSKMRYNQSLTTWADNFNPRGSKLANSLANQRLKSKFADQMSAIRESIIALRDAIEAEVNPPKEDSE